MNSQGILDNTKVSAVIEYLTTRNSNAILSAIAIYAAVLIIILIVLLALLVLYILFLCGKFRRSDDIIPKRSMFVTLALLLLIFFIFFIFFVIYIGLMNNRVKGSECGFPIFANGLLYGIDSQSVTYIGTQSVQQMYGGFQKDYPNLVALKSDYK